MESLNFQVKFECSEDLAELRLWFRDGKNDISIIWDEFKDTGHTNDPVNWIRLKRNEYYDPDQVNAYDGWFYYPYLVEAIFDESESDKSNVIVQKKQAKLIRQLSEMLTRKGCLVKIICDPELENMLSEE